jgi:hypothetical protein
MECAVTYIVRSKEDMVTFVIDAIDVLQRSKPEMLVLPIIGVDSVQASLELLLRVNQFSPRRSTDDLPAEAVGVFKLAGTQAVHVALDQLESGTLVDPYQMVIAAQCHAAQHVPGRTRLVKTMLGDINVDLKAFAALTGLPLESDSPDLYYCVFLIKSASRTILVAVNGRSDTADGCGGSDSALEPLLGRLEVQARGLDTPDFFHSREFKNGWELLHNKLFREAIGKLRSGYWHLVEVDSDRGGLKVTF